MLLLDEHCSLPSTREKIVDVPLAARIVPVAMANMKSIDRAFSTFVLLSSTDKKERKKKNYEMFMTDSVSDVKRWFVEYLSKICCVVIVVCV
jgi:hypothetical protein